MVTKTIYRLYTYLFCSLLATTSGFCGLTSSVHAQMTASGRTSAQSAHVAGHVTVIVLDESGSMATNDPDGIRCSAANAYIDLSGVNDQVGVVGLDSSASNSTGGSHNFVLAQSWSQPVPMDTRAERQALKDTIASKSNHCAPDQSTPTYDALSKALEMLKGSTRSGKQGSVILLTDGLPAPQETDQIAAINTDLLPQFQASQWPIDVIALGDETQQFDFLRNLANKTEGQYYQDNQGVVSGTSPLNITPFFVDIFSVRNHRTLGPTLGKTPIDPGTKTSRDFQVGDFVDNLDIIAVTDQPGSNIVLTAPDQRTFPPEEPGTFVYTDPHYAIFSVQSPHAGTWTLSVTGSGNFLMDSLLTSSLKVVIDQPLDAQTVPLGQQFLTQAHLTSAGTTVGKNQFALQEKITNHAGYNTNTPMTWNDKTNAYELWQTVPETVPAGSYEIDISASAESGVPITGNSVVVRLDHFPTPLFLIPGTHKTAQTVDVMVTRWNPVLVWAYALPLPFAAQLGQKLLPALPTNPHITQNVQMELQGQLYTQPTQLRARVTYAGAPEPQEIEVITGKNGQFTLQFPPQVNLKNGPYTVIFQISGSYKDVHDFGTIPGTINVKVVSATPVEQTEATLFIALIYPILLFLSILLIILILRFPFVPKPIGTYTTDQDAIPHAFGTRRGLLRALRQRNSVTSSRAIGYPGLELLINDHGTGRVRVRRRGYGRNRWFDLDERPLREFTRVDGVIYSPDGTMHGPDNIRYSFNTATPEGEDLPPSRQSRRRSRADSSDDLYDDYGGI